MSGVAGDELRKLATGLVDEADREAERTGEAAPAHVYAMAQVWRKAAAVADASNDGAPDVTGHLVGLFGAVAQHAMACIESRKGN